MYLFLSVFSVSFSPCAMIIIIGMLNRGYRRLCLK